MPTYEYICDACSHTFDEFQMMSEEPLTKCPECGKKKLRRAFGTGSAIIFKGSGFYQTDYRSDTYTKAAKADSESSSAAPAASGKTDTTSAAPTSPAPSDTKTSTKSSRSSE